MQTILCIDDNPANLRLVGRILVRGTPHAKLLTAQDGAGGLRRAFEREVDLILLDVNLPDMQGEEFLSRLRNHAPTASTPVLMLSADATPSVIDHYLSLGASGYLTKPFDIAHLLTAVAGLLKGVTPGLAWSGA
ncbi:MAG: response regulator [Actinomycetota bacterium]|nr:response regulator [Actinomycetota bacterium]